MKYMMNAPIEYFNCRNAPSQQRCALVVQIGLHRRRHVHYRFLIKTKRYNSDWTIKSPTLSLTEALKWLWKWVKNMLLNDLKLETEMEPQPQSLASFKWHEMDRVASAYIHISLYSWNLNLIPSSRHSTVMNSVPLIQSIDQIGYCLFR